MCTTFCCICAVACCPVGRGLRCWWCLWGCPLCVVFLCVVLVVLLLGDRGAVLLSWFLLLVVPLGVPPFFYGVWCWWFPVRGVYVVGGVYVGGCCVVLVV